MGLKALLRNQFVTPEIEAAVNRIPKPVGSFGYDPWGYNVEGVKVWMSVIKPLYEHYFRVSTDGLENIPSHGRVLVVANHGGQLPVDGALIGYSMATNQLGPRAPRIMIERWVPTLPFVGNAMNEAGAVIGDPENCVKMLRNEEAVIVFPEGLRGATKPYRKAYQLQRFGTGFMHIAIKEKCPILPVGVIGCEEIMPSVGNFKPLASLLNAPAMPMVLPFLIPARVRIKFGELMHFDGEITNELDIAAKVNQVKKQIDRLLKTGLEEREGWFR